MKKTLTLILAVLLTAAASGCKEISNDIKDTVNGIAGEVNSYEADSDSSSESEDEFAEDSENAVTNKKKYKKVYITDPNKKDKDKSDSDSSDKDDDESNSDSSNDEQGNNGSGSSAYSADEIYQDALRTYNRFLLSCPYALDSSDTDANGFEAIADSDVSSMDDIISGYCTVFDEPDSYIYEKYVEEDGKVYCNGANRGSNIYYAGTDLEYVSGDESYMTFNAVSHYRDPETGEELEDKTAAFSVKLTDDGYKVTEFHYPQ